jgi:hypothetical protein
MYTMGFVFGNFKNHPLRFGLRDMDLLLRLPCLCLRCVSEAFRQFIHARFVISVVFIVGDDEDPVAAYDRVRSSYTFSHIA